jgi:hypothetical protein
MNTFYSILVSDGAVALHFLVTMSLLALVIFRGIRTDTKLRRLAVENSDLRRHLVEWTDHTVNSMHEMRDRLDAQGRAVSHTADCLAGTAAFDATVYDALQSMPEIVSDRDADLLAVDLVEDNPVEPDLSMADSAFVEPTEHLEPDVSLPLRAAMGTIHPTIKDDPPAGLVDSDELQQPDIMTRVLHRSKGG